MTKLGDNAKHNGANIAHLSGKPVLLVTAKISGNVNMPSTAPNILEEAHTEIPSA